MEIKLIKFIDQIYNKLKNPDNVITSIGTWCGNGNVCYTLHCKQTDGKTYDIDIIKEV